MFDAQRVLDYIAALSCAQDLPAAERAIDGILSSIRYPSFVVLRTARPQYDAGWRIVGRSAPHDELRERAGGGITGLGARIGPDGWIEPGRSLEPAAGRVADVDDLLRQLHGAGATCILAICSRPRPGLGRVALLACGTGDPASYEPGRADALALLRTTLSSLMEACHDRIVEQTQHMPRVEREVLAGFAIGLRPAEISRIRGTSVRTIRNQLENARRRLGANSNVHAVTIAIETGIIETGIAQGSFNSEG